MALLRPQTVDPRIPEIGRLFKGAPKTSNGRFGEDLDHFRFEPGDGLPVPVQEELKNRYAEIGESPRSIRVRFQHSSPEDIFKFSNEVWKEIKGAARCTRRCDGEVCTLSMTERGTLTRTPTDCKAGPDDLKCPAGCVPTGRLFFLMPDLAYPGQVVFTTHSIHDIMEIRGNLEAYRSFDLRKIPFKLCRTLKTIFRTDPNTGDKLPMKKWLCHIEIDPEVGLLLQEAETRSFRAALQQSALSPQEGNIRTRQLPAGATIDITPGLNPYQVDSDESSLFDHPTWTTFADLIDRATSLEQLHKAEQWIRSPKQMATLEGFADVDTFIGQAVAAAASEFSSAF